MSTKTSNVPLFTTPTINAKTAGIIKNTMNNQIIIPDPTGITNNSQMSTTVLKRVSFYIPENQCQSATTKAKVHNYPKDKYDRISLKPKEFHPLESTIGAKLGNKIDGVIKMGSKLTNKLDNVIRTGNKHDKFETPRFEIKVDATKSESGKSNDKEASSSAPTVKDFNKNYALKWERKPAKLFIPNRNSEDNIVLDHHNVNSNECSGKTLILHSLKYVSCNSIESDFDDAKNKWLWDIISNKKMKDAVSSDLGHFETGRNDLLDGFEIFCQQMSQGAGTSLINTLTNKSNNDSLKTEFIKDYDGTGNDLLLHQGKPLYVIPPSIGNDNNGSFDKKNTINNFSDNYDDLSSQFMPIGKGMWRWASFAVTSKETRSRSTQTNDDVESITLDTTLGPGFEFIYSNGTNEIYKLAFQSTGDDLNDVNSHCTDEDYDCGIYNLTPMASVS